MPFFVRRASAALMAPGGVQALGRRDRSGPPGRVVPFPSREGTGAPELFAPAGASDLASEEMSLSNDALRLPGRSPEPNDAAAQLERELTLWRSPRMRELLRIARQAAAADVTVLIVGETGTGKDLVARAIHHLSNRRGRPFMRVNCAAVPYELLESELFGHERGAFTGAHQQKIGTFEAADLGTVFLDEIGELHPALQAKLLHVLQDGTFSRVGGKSIIKVDVRVLAATNRNLEQAMAEQQFREDLYYRLNVIQLGVPPLRERLEEVPGLVQYFIERYSEQFNRHGFTPSAGLLERLGRYRYPGNVRELENLVKRMIVFGDLPSGEWPADQPAEGGDVGGTATRETLSLKDIARNAARVAERDVMERVLAQTGWNRVRAAKLLNISYRALLYKIKDVGLDQKRTLP